MKTKLFSVGQNQKLGKKIAVFNLPQGCTCPGRTAVCERICYAKKAEKLYKEASAKRAANLEYVMQHLGAPGPLEAALIAEIIGSRVDKVRIHESGDFFDQNYLDMWIRVAGTMPRVTFLAYTKSFHLDFSKAPTNMKIYASTDSSTPKDQLYAAMLSKYPAAHLVLKDEDIPEGYATCKHSSPKNYCGLECKICWIGKASVYFPQH